ncbi:PP2C family protein-serine/threonine phosphatase [Flexithrix dorotheae]|uniref:PP2C family protein-serine/threonine phosphatase n=1 Tax=Flexithrix dorotheae TaxID=70993 RepID=UPI00036FF7D7|nr:7TM diverse intracellular signaling domain-containing protein [Flexithrix dorotheae]
MIFFTKTIDEQIRIYFYSFIIFLFLFSCTNQSQKEVPKLKKGVINLQEWDLLEKGNVKLNGEWEFHWKKLIGPENKDEVASNSGYIKVPGEWDKKEINGEKLSGDGYATYRAKVKLHPNNRYIGLYIDMPSTAFQLYVNGIHYGSAGKIGKDKASTTPLFKKHLAKIISEENELDIVLQVANFHHLSGGLRTEVLLGEMETLENSIEMENTWVIMILGSIFIMAFYHLGIFILRKKYHTPLFFSLFCLCISIRIGVITEPFLTYFSSLNWLVGIKIEYTFFYLSLPAFAWFALAVFKNEVNKKIVLILTYIGGAVALTTALTSPKIFRLVLVPYQILIIISCIYFIFCIVKAIRNKREGSVTFLLGWGILFFTIFNDILYTNNVIDTANLVSFGLFILIFSQAFVLSSRFTNAFEENEILTEELGNTNKNLELKVEERTKTLKETNLSLGKKNKQITESIQYASKIQNAILTDTQFNKDDSVPEFFVFFKPRDIVSGDFYWIKQVGDSILFVAADCTGHGVPGAFMSILGIAYLNEIVSASQYKRPDIILNELRDKIKKSLNQTSELGSNKDGMDIAICEIDLKNKKLKFAGAYNPLYLVRNKELLRLRADKMPIGVHKVEDPFTHKEMDLEQDDMIYIFSDGFQDQIGGAQGQRLMAKKFKELLLEIHKDSVEEQKNHLDHYFNHWKGDYKQIDDVLILGLRINELATGNKPISEAITNIDAE